MKINARIDNNEYEEIEKITAGGKEINLSATANLQEKTATANGIVTADSSYDGLSKVTINVSGGSSTLVTKTITENGTYNASSDNADGYSSVEVNVSGSGGITPTGSQTFTSNGTYDVTNIAQAIVNVAEGGSIENIEMGTVVLTDEDVTNKKFSFELQNAADMVLVYPTFQQVKTDTQQRSCFLMFNKSMVKFLGSSEAVSELGNQVYGIGTNLTSNTLLQAATYTKGADNINGIFDKTVNVNIEGTTTLTLIAGTYKFIAFRGVVQ